MNFPTVSIRHGDNHVLARVEFVPKPPIVGTAGLRAEDVLQELKGRRIDAGALAALDEAARGRFLRLDLGVAGLLLADSPVGEIVNAANLSPDMELSTLGMGPRNLEALGGILSRLLRHYVNISQLTPNATVKDVVALVRSQVMPVPNPVIQELSKWPSYPAQTPKEFDSVMLGIMALEKWNSTCKYGVVVGGLEEFQSCIATDAKVDATALLALKQDQIPAFPVGVCLIHRTWTNNLFIDFLAGNPAIATTVSGIGKALLYAVSHLAIALKASRIWAETSSFSAPVYERILKRTEKSLGDELDIPVSAAADFIQSTDDRWNALVDRGSK